MIEGCWSVCVGYSHETDSSIPENTHYPTQPVFVPMSSRDTNSGVINYNRKKIRVVKHDKVIWPCNVNPKTVLVTFKCLFPQQVRATRENGYPISPFLRLQDSRGGGIVCDASSKTDVQVQV